MPGRYGVGGPASSAPGGTPNASQESRREARASSGPSGRTDAGSVEEVGEGMNGTLDPTVAIPHSRFGWRKH